MTKTPDLVNSKTSSNNQLLKPALIAALANLDIKLEEELPRYRRDRRKELAQRGRVITPAQGQQPDLIYISASGGRTNPSQPTELPPPPVSLETKTVSEPIPENILPAAPKQPQLPTGLTVANQTQTIAGQDNPGEKYLESSEQLIKTLGEDDPKQPQRNTSESLLSPLGIGSMLLFLMASITFGYVISKPANLAYLAGNRPTNKPNPSPAATPTTAPVATVAPLPTTPNLAAREFVEVDLDTLSNLSPKTTPPPAPKPAAQNTPVPVTIPNVPLGSITPAASTPAPSNSLNKLSEALLPPAKQPKPATTTTPAATRTPLPSPTVAATPKPSSNSDDYYYVVTDYTGPASLDKALEVVGDAYTREFPSGTLIQLGAFNDVETAKVVVSELQRQGVSAKVLRP